MMFSLHTGPWRAALLGTAVVGLALSSASAATPTPRPVALLPYSGVINPVASEYVDKGLEKARAMNAQALVLQLDTPGGLDKSMRLIVKSILASPIPVVVYVAPAGSRAASAGVFITMAAHVAAMAPGTNIGAAHPVALGGGKMDKTMIEKVENDAAAYIRSLAERWGRNADWAEEAVRKSVSIQASEAVEKGVVDLLAPSLEELLAKIDGRVLQAAGQTVTLATAGAPIETVSMTLKQRILSFLSHPNVAYLLMLLGLYGIFFELSSPGAVFPGIVGGIAIILAAYALQLLPVNWAGLALMALALVLFLLEIKVPSHGALTIGGVVALTLGSLMLFDSPDPLLRVSLKVIIPAVVVTSGFFFFLVGKVAQAHRARVTTGREGLVGAEGIVRKWADGQGTILLRGELWKAESQSALVSGQEVTVTETDGLTLTVTPPEGELK
ncbi:MAG: nodulation protein NfeD [Nitrospinae bacterium]|nr:nodulation protein NfeD [Nitrospinota bacterium]